MVCMHLKFTPQGIVESMKCKTLSKLVSLALLSQFLDKVILVRCDLDIVAFGQRIIKHMLKRVAIAYAIELIDPNALQGISCFPTFITTSTTKKLFFFKVKFEFASVFMSKLTH